jgi:phospholipid/cholesterol/gamma-HCH transport system permease protein
MSAPASFPSFLVDVGEALLRAPPLEESLREAYNIGVRSMPVLFVISVFVGTNLALSGYSAFAPLGGQGLVGMFVALAGVRELAPILAAAMVAAKAGTEMASALAVMRTREQVDALEVMAVSPAWWLVVPRLLGILLVMPALTTLSIGLTVASAWAVAKYQLHLNGDAFLVLVRQSITGTDLLAGVVKALVFGALICVVSCYHGLTSRRGPEGVGRATNLAVVISAVSIVISNALVSLVLYGG